jgi:hypothetical protein
LSWNSLPRSIACCPCSRPRRREAPVVRLPARLVRRRALDCRVTRRRRRTARVW